MARHPAVDEALESLRRGSPRRAIAGLTDPGQGALVAVVAIELAPSVLLLVDTERRAEELHRAVAVFWPCAGCSPRGRCHLAVVLLPALDALPGQGVGPHPEILETRATTLWRFVSGQVSVIVAPVAATLLQFRRSWLLRTSLSCCARPRPGRLARRGAHAPPPCRIRVAPTLWRCPASSPCAAAFSIFSRRKPRGRCASSLLGDTVESLREFDPETQRSTGPVSRVLFRR